MDSKFTLNSWCILESSVLSGSCQTSVLSFEASHHIQISNFLLIRVLHLDDNDVKTNYRRIFSTVSASTPFSTNK